MENVEEEVENKFQFKFILGKERKMTNWNEMLNRNTNAVIDFANGNLSKDEFRQAFSNGTDFNPARRLVVSRGAKESRALARKALRRRGLLI